MRRWGGGGSGTQDGPLCRQHLPEGRAGQTGPGKEDRKCTTGAGPEGFSPFPEKCWVNLADPVSRLLVALREARCRRHPTGTSCPWGGHTPWGRGTRELPRAATGVAPCSASTTCRRRPGENLAPKKTRGVAPRASSTQELLAAELEAGWRESRPRRSFGGPRSGVGGLARARRVGRLSQDGPRDALADACCGLALLFCFNSLVYT